MTQRQTFRITVTLVAGGARADLMAMASVMSRRGVSVLDAELTWPSDGRRLFRATFRACPSRAETVLETFRNQIDALGAYLISTDSGCRSTST
jgi:hypothetical protein